MAEETIHEIFVAIPITMWINARFFIRIPDFLKDSLFTIAVPVDSQE